MDRKTVAELLDQIIQGKDIPAPGRLLGGLTAARAAERLPGHPYSILENLWHAVFWQTIWLERLDGKASLKFTEDWQSPDASEFPRLKKQFLANLDSARAHCSGRSFKHKMKSDAAALKVLVAMAIHDSYHMGQINVIKRASRAKK